jgi:hypothetical protein
MALLNWLRKKNMQNFAAVLERAITQLRLGIVEHLIEQYTPISSDCFPTLRHHAPTRYIRSSGH